MAEQVDEYLKEKGSDLEQEIAADIILQILDVVLKSEFSLNSQLVSIFRTTTIWCRKRDDEFNWWFEFNLVRFSASKENPFLSWFQVIAFYAKITRDKSFSRKFQNIDSIQI